MRPRPYLVGRRADILEPEGDLVLDAAEDDLVLGILEEGGELACEIRRPKAPRVLAGDHDPALEAAAVEVRDEARERPQKQRLAGAGGAGHRDDLAPPGAGGGDPWRGAGVVAPGYRKVRFETSATAISRLRRGQLRRRGRSGRAASREGTALGFAPRGRSRGLPSPPPGPTPARASRQGAAR